MIKVSRFILGPRTFLSSFTWHSFFKVLTKDRGRICEAQAESRARNKRRQPLKRLFMLVQCMKLFIFCLLQNKLFLNIFIIAPRLPRSEVWAFFLRDSWEGRGRKVIKNFRRRKRKQISAFSRARFEVLYDRVLRVYDDVYACVLGVHLPNKKR